MQTATSTVEETIAEARARYRAADWIGGQALLEGALTRHTDDVDGARLKLALVNGANSEDWTRGLQNHALKHRLLDEVDPLAEASGDDALLASALFERGMALHIDFIMAEGKADFDRERTCFERAAQLYERSGDNDGAVAATAFLGIFYHVDVLDRASAQPILERAMAMAPQDRPTYGAYEAARHLGQIQQELGDPAGAIAMLEESYRLRVGSGSERGLASPLHALAYARLEAGDLEGAARDLARARAIAERYDAQFILAFIGQTEADLRFARIAPGLKGRTHP